jgi:arylsulfatase
VHFQRQTADHVVRDFRNVTTLAECLRAAGYRTFSTGKWHLPGKPTEHGFDRFFGLQGGASNHFDPTGRLGMDANLYLHREVLLDDKPAPALGDDFYTTDAFTDYALKFLRETPADQPFFLYLAYTAPHWPLQAPAETIEKYKGRYDGGWEALREERFAHMRQAGLIPEGWSLPPLPGSLPKWSQVADPKAKAQLMEVHAAMVDRMDQGIGRLLEELEKEGRLENTIIFFASDNGAIGAVGKEARFDRTPSRPAGTADSFRMLPAGFAYAVNTPWRGQKLSHLAGGNTSPLIVRWPGKVPSGVFSWQTVNILDVMPTLLSVAGASYPEGLQSLDGHDVSALLTNPTKPAGGETPHFLRLVFTEADEHAIVEGHWKAHRSGPDAWRLYDLKTDGTETKDSGQENAYTLENLVEKFSKFEKEISNIKPTNP